MKPAESHRPPWLRVLALVVAAHLLFCVQRLATKSLPARLDEISEFREKGAIRFHLARCPESAACVEFLVRHTPDEAVVLYRGEDRGTMELAASLLVPRLLVRESAVAPSATEVHGRPLARATHPELGTGTLVLVGVDRATVDLALR